MAFNIREICPMCGSPTSNFKRYTDRKYLYEMLREEKIKESPLCDKCKKQK